MPKKKISKILSRKNLGIATLAGLIIQFILPEIGLRGLGWIATLIYLTVGIILTLELE